MKIVFLDAVRGDAVIWPVWEGDEGPSLPETLAPTGRAAFARAIAATRFAGKPGQIVELIAPAFCDAERVVLVGLGKKEGCDAQAWRKAGASAVRHLLCSGAREAALVASGRETLAANAAFGGLLAAYRFDTYRPGLKPEKLPSLNSLVVVTADPAAAAEAFRPLECLADGVVTARDLVSEPPNILHPESFAARIEALSDTGLDIEIVDEEGLAALDMRAMLAVGQGSVRKSHMAVIRWNGASDKSAKPLVLVGKGLTFDAGGISIKPAANMEAMKGDMAGAAAVVGVMKTLARRGARANVVGIVGLVENMADGGAFRPGDILTSAAGKTIEVVNTDAEGRLVLCDLLHYAQTRFEPEAIIDLATLTGAIMVALGSDHAGLFANNDALAERITAAGKGSGEPVWRLPLGASYDKLIESSVADMKNSGGRAGSITAAQFLQRFVAPETPWAHLDIAGTAWKDKSDDVLEPSWATGFGVRLLDRLVADSYEGDTAQK